MATAVASAVALNPTASWSSLTAPLRTNILPKTDTTLGLLFVSTLTLGTLAAPFLANNKKKEAKKESSSADEEEEISNGWKTLLPAAFAGASLAAGLAKSGMVVASKLYSFLDFSGIADGRWDPTPALVLGIAVPISMLSYQLVDGWSLVGGMKKPLCAAKFGVPQNSVVDSNLVLGSACLGIGWSVGVCCPGAAMLKAALGDIPIFQYWIPAYIFGSLLAQKYKDYQSSSGVKPKTL